MFGYMTPDRAELKGKDQDRYRLFYCGLCRDLQQSCGELARATLTYDMTFLGILLSALYEGPAEVRERRCILHPMRKTPVIRNEYTAYAADMNLLVVWHELEDDWIDDRNVANLAASRVLRRAYLRTAEKYPRQVRAIRQYLKALHEEEKTPAASLDLAANLTGTLFAELCCMQEDLWADELRALGFAWGRLVYLMDAWDDLEKDMKKGSYNPFVLLADKEDREERILQILTVSAAEAARAFERLPILEEVDILRNILYSGVWVKYRSRKAGEKKQTDV